MPTPTAPPVAQVDVTLVLGSRTVDLATRGLVVATLPTPRWARETEMVAGAHAARDAGADLVDVPPDPRLIGPVVAAIDLPVAVRVDNVDAARAAREAGATVLLVPAGNDTTVAMGDPTMANDTATGASDGRPWQVATLVTDAAGARDAALGPAGRPVALDVTRLSGVDAVSEESLALAVGARLVRTTDVRRTRRVVEVMAHLLEARR